MDRRCDLGDIGAHGIGAHSVREHLPIAMVTFTIGYPSPSETPGDFQPSSIQYHITVGIFPLHQLLDDTEEPLALSVLIFFGWEAVRPSRGVVHKLTEKDCPTCSKRTAGPP